MSVALFNKKTLSERNIECQKILLRHPDKVPVLIEFDEKIEAIDNRGKYLVQDTATLGEFLYKLRKHVKIGPSEALFIMDYKTGVALPNGVTMKTLSEKYKDIDGFTKLLIKAENVFG